MAYPTLQWWPWCCGRLESMLRDFFFFRVRLRLGWRSCPPHSWHTELFGSLSHVCLMPDGPRCPGWPRGLPGLSGTFTSPQGGWIRWMLKWNISVFEEQQMSFCFRLEISADPNYSKCTFSFAEFFGGFSHFDLFWTFWKKNDFFFPQIPLLYLFSLLYDPAIKPDNVKLHYFFIIRIRVQKERHINLYSY